ncbi:MAG TPA: hypothetical protein VLF40_02975 [Candidatus Saccharimonadales bacterium]|nr:hypothetical protein [Candidatus Saccharimonadales bacterium]
MLKGFSKYRLVYSHLWQTYGRHWQVQVSFAMRIISRLCYLVGMPVALSLIITDLSKGQFGKAEQAVLLFASFSLFIGILSPLTKYVGMLGENKAYRVITGNYFSRLVSADLDYFNSNLAGYLTTATRRTWTAARYWCAPCATAT